MLKKKQTDFHKDMGASNIFYSSAVVLTVMCLKINLYVIYVQRCNLIRMFMCNYNSETCLIFFSSHPGDTAIHQIYGHYHTYPTNFFKIRPMASKVDELFIEEPGELEVQRGVMSHLAGQHDALSDSHIHVSCWTGDQSLLCERRSNISSVALLCPRMTRLAAAGIIQTLNSANLLLF